MTDLPDEQAVRMVEEIRAAQRAEDFAKNDLKTARAQLAEREQLQDKIKSLGCQCDLDVGFICNTCNHKEVVAENDRLRAQLAERDAEIERLLYDKVVMALQLSTRYNEGLERAAEILGTIPVGASETPNGIARQQFQKWAITAIRAAKENSDAK